MIETSPSSQAELITFESSSSQLKKWQLRLLSGAFLLGMTVSVIILGLSFFESGNPFQPLLIVGSVILGFGSAILLLLKNVSFWIRSVLFLVILFIFVNTSFFFYGWGIPSLGLLIGFITISTSLLFRKSIRYGLIISFLTLVLWAALTVSGSLTSSPSGLNFPRILNDSFIVSAIGLFVYFSIYLLKDLYLLKIDENQEKVKEILETNQKYLESQSLLQEQKDKIYKLVEFTNQSFSSVDQKAILKGFADEIGRIFDLSLVLVYLVDPGRNNIQLHYGTGDLGQQLLKNGHFYTLGGPSVVSHSVLKKAPQKSSLSVFLDYVQVLGEFTGQEITYSLPLLSGNKNLGALVVVTKPTAKQDVVDSAIFQAAANFLSQYINLGKPVQTGIAPTNASISFENLLQQNKKVKYQYPEDEVFQPDDQSVQSEVDLDTEHLPLGILKVFDRELTSDEVTLVKTLTLHLGQALERSVEQSRLHKTLVSEQKSREISSRFFDKKNMGDVLRAAVKELGQLPDVIDAGVALIPPEESIVRHQRNGRKNDANE